MRARDEQVQARALALLARGRPPGRAGEGPGSDPAGGRSQPGTFAAARSPAADSPDGATGPVRPTPQPPPLVALPAGLRSAVASVSWPAVAGLLVVLLLVVLVVAGRVVLARDAAAPVPVHRTAAEPQEGDHLPADTSAGSASPSGAVVRPGAAAPTTSTVVVDVAGAVASPGVQRLPVGARVVDAIVRAGGTTPDAVLDGLNRARVLVDGELLRVPRRGEAPPPQPAGPLPGAGSGPAPGAGGSTAAGAQPGAGGAAVPGAPVDLNTADATALDTLPGVGPAIAGRILDWRREHGRFSSVDELGEVSGIGDKLMERLRPLVRVGP